MSGRSDAIDFGAWYHDRYRPLHASLLAFFGDRELATEAADEAFARALQHWRRVGAMESPDGWVWVVARNVGRRLARRRARERAAVVGGTRGDGPPADVGVELWDAVERLPARERELVALRYVLDLGEVDIARTLGLAPGTVARSLHDARGRLRVALSDPETEESR